MSHLKPLSLTHKHRAYTQRKRLLFATALPVKHLQKTKFKKNQSSQDKTSIFKYKAFTLSMLGVLLFLPVLSIAQKNKIWVKSHYTSFQDFLVFIKSSNFTSYADHLLNKKREHSNSFKLKDILIKAQELYLLGETERAVQVFTEISNLAYKANWSQEERRIIMYALLRKAQIQEDKEKRKALLVLASDFFAIELSRDSYLDYNLFPPPLMEQLQKIQTNKNKLSPNWNKVFPQHEIILLNGQRLDKNKSMPLPQAVYKITALSSSHKAWSKNISLSELLGQTIKTSSLSRGSCKKPMPAADIQIKNIKIAPISSCPSFNPLKIEEAFNLNNLEASTSSKKITENWPAWAVIGASAVILSLAIFLGGSKDEQQTDDYVY